jgi:hypothetical protein
LFTFQSQWSCELTICRDIKDGKILNGGHVQGQKKIVTTRHRWRPHCRIAHGWKKSESFVSQSTWHPSLHFYFSFLSLDSSLSYIYCYLPFSLFLFLFFIHILFLSHIFFFLFFLSFLFHTHTFLFIFLSLDNFSKLSTLSFSHAYNLKF